MTGVGVWAMDSSQTIHLLSVYPKAKMVYQLKIKTCWSCRFSLYEESACTDKKTEALRV